MPSCREVRERHPEIATHPRIHVVNLAGEAVGRQPLCHGSGIQEGPINAICWRA